jgi:hypothetical protein
MFMAKKTWLQKFNIDRQPVVEITDKTFADIPKGSKMLIATPKVVDEYIRQIPKGHHTSLQQMRKDLAAEFGAEYSCPITSGIFLRIASELAYEQYQNGTLLKKITPFWRMIDKKAPLSKKLSFGYDFVAEQRKKEGLDS